MAQATMHADPTPESTFRFWHLAVTMPYFISVFLLFGEMTRSFLSAIIGKNHYGFELLIGFAFASIGALGIVRFIAETSYRNSKERLGLVHRASYYAAIGIGWLGFIAIPASLVAGMMLFSNAKFSPGHQLGASSPPSIEAR